MKKKPKTEKPMRSRRRRHYHCLGKFGYTFECHAKERRERIKDGKAMLSEFAPQNHLVEMLVTTDIKRVTCLECVDEMLDALKKRRLQLRKEATT